MKPNLLLLIIALSIYTNLTAQINTEKFRQDSARIGFSGIANVEITAVSGNTDFQFISLGGRLNYNWGVSYTFLVADGGFGWDEGKRIFNQALLHLRHVQSFTELIQSEIFIQTDFNKKRLLNQRELIGGGIRLRVLSNEKLKLRLGTSYFYEHEIYSVSATSIHGSNKFASRVSTYLTLEYQIADYSNLVMINYFQPQIGNWEDYRIISDISFITSISSFVDLKVSFNLRYDSKPPETIKSTDTITKFGFGFKF